jgi:hypothetical protein
MIAIALLALAVFLFVLEPVLRARGDEVVLDASALPRVTEPVNEDAAADAADEAISGFPQQHEEPHPGGRVALDRPASSDVT